MAHENDGELVLAAEETAVFVHNKIRPYDHLWDMYYDEFEDEVEAEEPSNGISD